MHGTTGYDFLANLNGIFVERTNAKAFDRLYGTFVKERIDFRELVYRCKLLIMQTSMSAEVSVLGHQLDRISERNRRSRDFTLNSLTEALREVIACFPVYRTYVNPTGVLERDRRYIEMAVSRAKRKNPATSTSIFDLVRACPLAQSDLRPGRRGTRGSGTVCRPLSAVHGAGDGQGRRGYGLLHPQSTGVAQRGRRRSGNSSEPCCRHSISRTSSDRRTGLIRSWRLPPTTPSAAKTCRARINVLSEIPREFRASFSLGSPEPTQEDACRRRPGPAAKRRVFALSNADRHLAARPA